MTNEELKKLIEEALGLEPSGFDCYLAELAPQLARALEQKIAECERYREALRKAILWGESVSMRLSPEEKGNLNWTYLEQAREALKGGENE